MKTQLGIIASILFSLSVWAQAPAVKISPSEQKILWAEKVVEKSPENYQTHNRLAQALVARGRLTANPQFYARAKEALQESFRLAPGNFEGEKIRIWVLLEKHEFAQALEVAKTLNRRAPDDVLVYGFLADAHVHLGNYEEAEEAAQWMLDLRPGNVPGLTRGAHLRELFGDIEGAIEFMGMAYQRFSPSEIEDRAWVLTRISSLKL